MATEVNPALIGPSQDDVLGALFTRRAGRRDFTPLARDFVQRRGQPGGGAGPLAAFVTARRLRALRLYLLLHAVASADPWDAPFPNWVWATAIGMPAPRSASAGVYISNTWRWLEGQQLVNRHQDGRVRRVYLLSDDATGQPYAHPQRDYFKLPHPFWTEHYAQRLSLAATTVLLIGLSLGPTFALPHDHAAGWYGVSRDTIRRGLHELDDEKLLDVKRARRPTPLSPTGDTERRRYALKAPFQRQ